MAKLTTKNFKLHHVRQFIESITEPSNTVYYVFAGNPGDSSFGVGAPPQIVESTDDMVTRIYDVMTHAKRVTSSDVTEMVKRINWQTGTVYDQYDSDTNLNEKNYFVVSPSGSENNYYVFKCLYNNYGAASTEQPQFSETSADDPYYETADGYVWKYLYTIDPYTFNKFSTDEYIPVVEDVNVTANAQPGAIDIIRVNYSGAYYNNWYLGQFTPGDIGYGGITTAIRLNAPSPELANISSISGDGSTVTVVTSTSHGYLGGATITINGTTNYDGTFTNITVLSSVSFTFSSTINTGTENAGTTELYISSNPYTSYTTNYYNNCIIKITSGVAQGQYRKILSYSGPNRIATVEYPFDADQADLELATYEIYPQCILTPDGRQTNTAIARAIVDPATANSISIIEVLEKGYNQQYATANVYADTVVRTSNTFSEANVSIIFPPKGGHGADPASELKCDRLGVSVKFSNNENSQISTDNTFRTIGLLKDPKFYKVRLFYTDTISGGSFVDGEEIAQLNTSYLGGSVGVDSSNLQIYSTGTFSGLGVFYGANTLGLPTGNNDPGSSKWYELTFANNDIIKVTNVVVTATANAETFANGNMVEGPTITGAGFGFSDPLTPVVEVQNTVAGYTRYLSSNNIIEVANGIHTSGANGKNYSIGDYFVVDTTFIKDANVVVTQVTGDGAIAEFQVVDAGRVLGNEVAPGGIEITAGGTTYTNNDLAVIDAPYFGSDTATANVLTDGSGVVIGLTFTNTGSGYTSIPTIDLTGSGDGLATATAKIQSKGTTYAAYNSLGENANGAEVVSITVDSAGPDIYDSTRDRISIVSPTTDGHANAGFANTATGNLVSVTLDTNGNPTSNNFGFTISNTNIVIAANSSDGNIRYFNSSGIVSNYALVEANPNTSISALTASANGGNYDSTMVGNIIIEDGGIGYDSTADNTLTFGGAPSTAATATFTNNEIGKIISITISDPGNGYGSAPSVTPASGAGGIGATLTSSLSNTITITSNTFDSGYGAVVYFNNTATGNVASISIANAGFGYLNTPTAIIQDANTLHDHVGSNTATFTITLDGGTDIYAGTDTILATGPDVNPNSSADLTVSSGEITATEVTDSGAGFFPNVIPEYYVIDSGGADIRRLSSTLKTSIIRDFDETFTGNTTGLFSNTDVLYVSGENHQAVANVATNPAGYLTSLTLSDSGSGIPDHALMELAVYDSSNTNIRRLNDTIVDSISVTAGGKGYNNNHILVIDSGDGTSNATFSVTTNLDGELVSFTPIDRGSGQKPAYISGAKIIDAGTGYDSTSDVFSIEGGGGSGATLAFSNNGSGVIDQVYITNSGINYNCAPSLVFTTTSGTNAQIQFDIIKPYKVKLFTDSSLNTIAESTDGSCYEVDVNMINTPTVYANLAYATVATANVVEPADLQITKQESANLFFVAQSAPSHTISLTNQSTSFDISISPDDYIFIQSIDGTSDLLQVDSVSNSSFLTVKDFPSFTEQGAAISVVTINAQGIIEDQGSGYIDVSNAVGTFTTGNTIIGFDSDASVPVSSITYNGIAKTNLNINQLFAYKYTVAGAFQEDEIIVAVDPLLGGDGTARFHSLNTGTNELYVTSPTGQFIAGQDYKGLDSAETVTIASGSDIKYEGDLVRGSGDIIYVEDLDTEIQRANNQSETIKVIVEF